MMRAECEVATRVELVKYHLAEAVRLRSSFNEADAELDLHILSLLDQLETLLWVLASEAAPQESSTLCH